MSADRELMLTRLIDAPREKLYRAWTNPTLLKQWFAPLPYITPVAELDVRPASISKSYPTSGWSPPTPTRRHGSHPKSRS